MKEVIPINYCVLVEPIEVELKSKGGIILATDDKKKFEQQAQVKAKILAIGELAFEDQLRNGLDCPIKVGDIVYHQRHVGMRLVDATGNLRLDRLIIKDLDVVAVAPKEDGNV